MLKYTVYRCVDRRNKYNLMFNLYKHDLKMGDFYVATFRRLTDLKKFLEVLDVDDGEVYFSNVLRKEED